MNGYKDELKCDRIIDSKMHKCNKSPARYDAMFGHNVCKRHQKELTELANKTLERKENE